MSHEFAVMFVLVCVVLVLLRRSSVRLGRALNTVFEKKIKKLIKKTVGDEWGTYVKINLVGDRPLTTSLWLIHPRTAGTPSLLLHQQCLESFLYT